MRCLVPLLLAVAACSPAKTAQAPPAAEPSLLGQWRIVSLDGRAPVLGRDGRPPVLTFDEHGYGGYAGCNAFGGQGLAHEGRFYGGFAMSTAMACGPPFEGQETGVQRLLTSAPRIEWLGPNRLAAMRGALRYGNGPNGEILLAGGGHWMVGDLVRRGSSEAARLAGRYEVGSCHVCSSRAAGRCHRQSVVRGKPRAS